MPGTNLLTVNHGSKLALTISPTLTDHPRANLVPWKLAINRAARGVFAEWDAYGLHTKGTETFHAWANSTDGAKISPKTLDGDND